MIRDDVRRVADTVMYEGYVLYPYRASAQKNRSRWQFGVLMPPAYRESDPCERDSMTAECLLEGAGPVTVTARFLQVQRRGRAGSADSWDEAVEQEITVTAPGDSPFSVPGATECPDGVPRTRQPVNGTVSARITGLPGPWGVSRLSVTLSNGTPAGRLPRREDALPYALVAAHLVITAPGGTFLSLTDPPEWAAGFAAECQNDGCWPVLAGDGDGGADTVLAAPIILPDYPSVAAESAGELYDGTEIDEILTLRTLALTDEEKAEARATDPKAAALIDRVEAVAADVGTLGQLHGTFRPAGPPGPAPSSGDVPWWDPEADASVSPSTDSVPIAGRHVARGSRVTLRPGAGSSRGADAQDMFLRGREALVEAVLRDVDDTTYLAVTLADDPAAGLQAAHGRFLYFRPEEVEPC